jgi:hypothetical protein
MVVYRPVIEDIKQYQRGNLPQEAVRMDTPSDDEIQLKAAPIAAILCIVVSATMFAKTFVNRGLVIVPWAVLVGVALGFVLLIVHEWLHAIVYPKDAIATIGRLKGSLTHVALCSYPLSRGRFILMCLLPFILGIIPLVIFIIAPASLKVCNGLMFGMACMGMVSPYVDVYNAILVLKNCKKTDKVMFYEDEMYKIWQY